MRGTRIDVACQCFASRSGRSMMQVFDAPQWTTPITAGLETALMNVCTKGAGDGAWT